MAYADAFSECMQGSNITIDPSAVTDPSYFGDAVKYIKSWLDGLDSTAKQALDDASQHPEKVAGFLVDANIAPGVPALLEAFDADEWDAALDFRRLVRVLRRSSQPSKPDRRWELRCP